MLERSPVISHGIELVAVVKTGRRGGRLTPKGGRGLESRLRDVASGGIVHDLGGTVAALIIIVAVSWSYVPITVVRVPITGF